VFAQWEAIYARSPQVVYLLRAVNANVDMVLRSHGYRAEYVLPRLSGSELIQWIDTEMKNALPYVRPVLAQLLIAIINTTNLSPSEKEVIDNLLKEYVGGTS